MHVDILKEKVFSNFGMENKIGVLHISLHWLALNLLGVALEQRQVIMKGQYGDKRRRSTCFVIVPHPIKQLGVSFSWSNENFWSDFKYFNCYEFY